MNVFDLAAKITLDTSGYENKLITAKDKFSSIAGKIGSVAANVGKISAVGVTASATAIAALTKSALTAYADYEQLTGGVETLFKDSSDTIMKYAQGAYKTAGLSANEYMQTVTRFSAALINSVGGDTDRAAELANTAITDMADNANKMGTSLESLQNAYTGFSRGNFTMLDNLALGFSGTKEGMQQLLDKAQEISGIKYDISSYADMVEAIHVVQTEMGITGTTAKEASETISGSIASAKSAWKNLVTGFGDGTKDIGKLTTNFVTSVTTAAKNIVSKIPAILLGIGEGIKAALPMLISSVMGISGELLPSLISSGTSMFKTAISAIAKNLPAMVEMLLSKLTRSLDSVVPNSTPKILGVIDKIFASVNKYLPQLLTKLIKNFSVIISKSVSVIESIIPQLIETLGAIAEIIIPSLMKNTVTLIENISTTLVEMLPQLPETVLYLLSLLADSIVENEPTIINSILTLITGILTTLTSPETMAGLIGAALDIVVGLGTGLIQALPNMLNTLSGVVVPNMITTLIRSIPMFINAGIELLTSLLSNLPAIIEGVTKNIPTIVKAVIDGLGEMVTKVPEIGKNLVKGLWEGIKSMIDWLWNKVTGWVGDIIGGIADLLGIHSPSRVMARFGKFMAEGLQVGWDKNIDKVMDDINSSMQIEAPTLTTNFDSDDNYNGSNRRGSVNITQYITTTRDTAADQQEEAMWRAERAVLMGV